MNNNGQPPARRSYRDYSRWEWMHSLGANNTLPVEGGQTMLAVGALQRIADSLERLVALLDPEEQARRAKQAEERREAEAISERIGKWRFFGHDQKRRLGEKLRAFFAPAEPDRLEKAAVYNIRYHLLRLLEGVPDWPQLESRDPEPGERQAALDRLAAFDPAIFDWPTFLGGQSKINRERITALLGRLAAGREPTR